MCVIANFWICRSFENAHYKKCWHLSLELILIKETHFFKVCVWVTWWIYLISVHNIVFQIVNASCIFSLWSVLTLVHTHTFNVLINFASSRSLLDKSFSFNGFIFIPLGVIQLDFLHTNLCTASFEKKEKGVYLILTFLTLRIKHIFSKLALVL